MKYFLLNNFQTTVSYHIVLYLHLYVTVRTLTVELQPNIAILLGVISVNSHLLLRAQVLCTPSVVTYLLRLLLFFCILLFVGPFSM